MALPPGYLDNLRQGLSVADIAGEVVEWDLRKPNMSSGDLWSKCPFHDDTSISFHVDDKNGYYYCFGCHAKGDAIQFLRESRNLSFIEAVLILSYRAGIEFPLSKNRKDPVHFENLIDVKDFIVKNFMKEHFLELGVYSGWSDFINNHPRLLRSLRWDDPDYPGCVMELVTKMNDRGDGSIEKLKEYLEKRFSQEKEAAIDTLSFSKAERHLGYRFEMPRNDIISVMMPFSSNFSPVFAVINEAAKVAQLPVRRADQVWNHSTIIHDILNLINHSAVVVCDLTGRSENVFYELGIAHAWGKPVIPITQSRDDVPFDLRHHRYLHYLNNEEGRKLLRSELKARLETLLDL